MAAAGPGRAPLVAGAAPDRPRKDASRPAPSPAEGTPEPGISRVPPALTPVAIRACTITVRPPPRALT